MLESSPLIVSDPPENLQIDCVSTQNSDSDSCSSPVCSPTPGTSRGSYSSSLNFPAAKKFAAGSASSARPSPRNIQTSRTILDFRKNVPKSRPVLSPTDGQTRSESNDLSLDFELDQFQQDLSQTHQSDTSQPLSPVDSLYSQPTVHSRSGVQSTPVPLTSSAASVIEQTQPHTQTRKRQAKDDSNNDEVFAQISNRLLDRLDNKRESKAKFFNFGQHVVQQLETLDEEIADDVIQIINNALYDAKKKQREKHL